VDSGRFTYRGAIPAVVALTGTAEKPATAVVGQSATVPAPPTTPAVSPAAAVQPPGQPALPADQVWQCKVNGQRIFSDSPCGAGASIRQLSAVNGMDAAPPVHTYRYPTYGPGAGYTPAPAYDADSSQDAQINEVYGANQYVIIEERRPHEHHPPPHPQFHALRSGHSTH
jgi:uncharacterized protein DUF4124